MNKFALLLFAFTGFFCSAFAQQNLEKLSAEELLRLGDSLAEKFKFKDAEPYLRKALEAREVENGREDTLYGIAAASLSEVVLRLGKAEEAVELMRAQRNIVEKSYGSRSTNFALIALDFATLLRKVERAQEAEENYLIAVSQTKEFIGEETPMHALALNNYAVFLHFQDRFKEAEKFYLKAKELREKIFGNQHTAYASVCNSLAGLYEQLGRYTLAEELHLTALEIRVKTFGKKHPLYAQSCNNLAILYFNQGLYDAAEKYFVESLNTVEEVLGKESREYAETCNNFAYFLKSGRQFAKADTLFQIAIPLLKKFGGEKSLRYGLTLLNLWSLDYLQGKYESSLAHLQEAKKIIDFALPHENSESPKVLNNYALTFDALGKYEKAEDNYREAIKILSAVRPPEFEFLIVSMLNLATTLSKQGKVIEADSLISELLERRNRFREAFFYGLTEFEKIAFLKSEREISLKIVNFYIKHMQDYPELRSKFFAFVSNNKSVVFSATENTKSLVLQSKNTELINHYNEYTAKRKFYIKAFQMSKEEREKKGTDLEILKKDLSDTEKSINKRVAQIFGPTLAKANLSEIKNSLGKNEVIIEILRAERMLDYISITDTVYYALILSKQLNNPVCVMLNGGKNPEKTALKYYHNAVAFKKQDTLSYGVFWADIAKALQEAKITQNAKIYLSPDGICHTVNFAELFNPQSRKFLIEERKVVLLNSSADFPKFKKRKNTLKKSFFTEEAAFFGYPQYGNKKEKEQNTPKTGDRFATMQNVVLRNVSVQILPGTRSEVLSIKELCEKEGMKVKTYLEADASEENIKNLTNPSVLHVATHGFFLKNFPENQIKSLSDAERKALTANKMMRSGLLLANCENDVPENSEDGILTADEVSGLSLRGTELVVLSACETGLGDIEYGEGVFGLQRAFGNAGAKKLLLSLRKVDDEATALLMTSFYKFLLKNFDAEDALLKACKVVKKKFPHPYYWGSFVLVNL